MQEPVCTHGWSDAGSTFMTNIVTRWNRSLRLGKTRSFRMGQWFRLVLHYRLGVLMIIKTCCCIILWDLCWVAAGPELFDSFLLLLIRTLYLLLKVRHGWQSALLIHVIKWVKSGGRDIIFYFTVSLIATRWLTHSRLRWEALALLANFSHRRRTKCVHER